jgi:hypothetical protein
MSGVYLCLKIYGYFYFGLAASIGHAAIFQPVDPVLAEPSQNQTQESIKKCVATYTIEESAVNLKPIKGLTEGVRWKTFLKSDYSIGDND